VYFTPFFGGIIADRIFGIRKTIIIGGLFMMCGHFLLAFRPLPFFFSALCCLIIGNGCFKPNISVMLGNLYRDIPEKKDDGYNIFYMGINVGAFFSPIVAASLRSLHPIHGWHYAFAAAGVGMIISLVTFMMFQKYVRAGENISGEDEKDQGMGREVKLTPEQSRRRVVTLLVIFAVVIFFWMAFHQNGLTLTFWARDATDTTLSPELFQSVNPFFVLAFTPLLVAFWNVLRRRKFEPSTAAKLGIGMLLTAACYAIMTGAALSGGNFGRVSVSWLISAYAVITLGELCLSPMGLSLVSKLAPWKIRGMMMGGWFAATAIGNYLSGLVGSLWDDLLHSTFFIILVITSLFAAGVLFLLLKFLNPTIKEAEEQARELAAQKKES
jgi:POT family proton-dependent oligopeptide transporter